MFKIILIIFLSLFDSNLYGANWSQTSASLLYGSGFSSPLNLDDKIDVSTLTFEHTSIWDYGDNFFFLDIYNIDDGDELNKEPPKLDGTREFYFEWHPRFSAKRIFFKTEDQGNLIADYGLATEINVPELNGEVYLYGIYIDFNLFDRGFLQTDYYVRDTIHLEGVAFQLSLVWLFNISDKLSFSGFADFATAEGSTGKENGYAAANIVCQPQLLYAFGAIQVGFEWYYWKNKYGVEGVVDSVIEPMIKWTF